MDQRGSTCRTMMNGKNISATPTVPFRGFRPWKANFAKPAAVSPSSRMPGRLVERCSAVAATGKSGGPSVTRTPSPARRICSRRYIMYALLRAHCHNNRIPLTDFFRAAYLKKYSKEMPYASLSVDVKHFLETQNTPCYCIDFLLDIYGVPA